VQIVPRWHVQRCRRCQWVCRVPTRHGFQRRCFSLQCLQQLKSLTLKCWAMSMCASHC